MLGTSPRVAFPFISCAGQDVWSEEQERQEAATVYQECHPAGQVWRAEHAEGIVCVCMIEFVHVLVESLVIMWCCVYLLQKEAEAYQAKVGYDDMLP